MKYLFLLAVFAAGCNYIAVPTTPFTSVFDLLLGKQGPAFTLCLQGSTAVNSFSLQGMHLLTITHLTIQYLSCRSAGSEQQILWLRRGFRYEVEGSLTLRNVRISGQKLLKDSCEEEWCTHCLVSPYLWPELGNLTVIERHSVVDETDPVFQCKWNIDQFLLVSSSTLIIDNSTLDNIRIRAACFISLEGSAHLTISQTNISRMDFTQGFIIGSAQEVLLSGLSVTGFNRDHAYVRDYPGDAGLVRLSDVGNFTLDTSVFSDNIQLQRVEILAGYNIKINNFEHLAIFSCIFRSTMSGISIQTNTATQMPSTVLISQCLFEGNFMIGGPFLKFDVSTEVHISISECSFRANIAAWPFFMYCLLGAESAIQLSNSVFVNNWAYVPAYSEQYLSTIHFFLFESVSNVTLTNCVLEQSDYEASSNLFAQLLAAQLINSSPQLTADFLDFPKGYRTMLGMVAWKQIYMKNVTLRDITSYMCLKVMSPSPDSVIYLDALIVRNVTTTVGLFFDRATNLRNAVFLHNSLFQAVRGLVVKIVGQDDVDTPVSISNITIMKSSGAALGLFQIEGASVHINDLRTLDSVSSRGLWNFIVASNNVASEVIVRNCEFRNNTGSAGAGDISIVSETSSSILSLEISNSSFEDFSGTSIYLDSVMLRRATIATCNFTGGRAASRTGLLVTTHAGGLLLLEDLRFSDYDDSDSYLIQINTPCDSAQERLTRLVRVVVEDCSFLAAVKLEGQLRPTYAETVSCSFLRNQGIVISSDGAVLSDNMSLFKTNTAEGYPCYFQDQQSSVTFQGTQFFENSATKTSGGCLYLRGDTSQANFRNCSFQANTAESTTAGVMRIEQFVKVEIHDCEFSHNSAAEGSALYLLNVGVPLLVVNSSFVGNKDGVISLMNSKLSLVGVQVLRSAGLVLVSSEVSAKDCIFAELTGTQGCVLSGLSQSNVTFDTVLVKHSHCTGDLLDFSENSSLLLTSSLLQNLTSNMNIIKIQEGRHFQAFFLTARNITAASLLSAVQTNVIVRHSMLVGISGQVFVSNNSALFSISNSSLNYGSVVNASVIACNRAQSVELQRLKVAHMWTNQIGVYLAAKEVVIEECTFEGVEGGYGVLFLQDSQLSLSASYFLSNKAWGLNSKGGALALANSPASITNCTFISNTAYQGGAIYWIAASPQMQNNVLEHNWAYYGPVVASGTQRLHSFNMSGIVLVSGQTVAGSLLVGLLDRSNQLVLVERSKHWLSGPALSGNLAATAERGLLRFSGFVVEGAQDHTVPIVFNTSAAVSPIHIQLRRCIAGEIQEKATCVTCPTSTYSVDPKDCSRCPLGGTCPGDGNLYPQPSYWRPLETYNGVLKCPNKDACEGHESYSSQTGHCAQLYQGNLCQKCEEGAGRSGPDKCAKCPSSATNYTLIIVLLIGTAVILAILTRSALKSAHKEASLTGTLLKILLNYVQMISLTARFPLNWPSALESFFVFHESAGNSGEQYMSVDCLVAHSLFPKVMVMATLPLILPVLNVLVWLAIWTFFQLLKKSLRVQEECICSTIVSLFYFHPMITRTALSTLQCFTILPGEEWLRVELSIRCWAGQHSFFALAVALPAAVMWGVGIPTLALLLLVRYRKRLRENRVQVMVGFLCAKYKTQFYFWEVITVYRKLSVILLLAFTSTLPAATQGLALVLLLGALALLQFNYVPFKKAALNSCELLGEVAVLLTVYTGLFFQFGMLSAGINFALFVFVTTANAAFLLSLVKVLLRNKVRILFRKWFPRFQVEGDHHRLRSSTKERYLAQLQAQLQLLSPVSAHSLARIEEEQV